MSRLVLFTSGSASGLARAVSGAPRATLAVVLVATLALASVLPQLQLVNSEAMWIPEGERADAYRALAAEMGATEYVGLVARAGGANVLTAASLAAVLHLEAAATANSSVAEAFRFPQDPESNALSVADLVAEADAVLTHRSAALDPLAEALAATVAGAGAPLAPQAVLQAGAAVRLLELARSAPQGALPLVERLVPELEVALLAGTDAGFRASAVALLAAAAEAANWTQAHGSVDPADAPLAAARALVEGALAHLRSNASAPSKAAAAGVLMNGVLSARAVLDLDRATLPRADALLAGLASGYEQLGASDPAGAFAAALARLARAVLFLDRLDPVAEPEAEAGLVTFASELAALLASNASAQARAGGASIAARLFEAVIAMGDRGLDLAVPQTNVSYESYSVALNENATTLASALSTHSQRVEAATNLSLRTTAFLGNLINLNVTGIFTDQQSFQRVLTMVVFLNETFAELDGLMRLPDGPAALAHPAAMVGHEVLHIVNTTAVFPHRIDVNASLQFAPALRSLEAAIRAGGAGGAIGLGVAAATLLAGADFDAAGLMPRAEEDLLGFTASSLEAAAAEFAGGDPPSSKATFAGALAGSFSGARVAPSAMGAVEARGLLAPLTHEVESLQALLAAGQSPALFVRFTNASLSTFASAFASPAGFVQVRERASVSAFLDLLAPVPVVLRSALATNATLSLFTQQAYLGASAVETRLRAIDAPTPPATRAAAADRITAMGDTEVSRVLDVLTNPAGSAPPPLASLPAGDARFQPFREAASAYHANLESDLRTLLGFRARSLLPHALATGADGPAAFSTVVLFLFNGSLDRPTLGAREAGLRDLARAHAEGAATFTAFGFGLMWFDTQAAMDLSVVLFALTMLVVMGAALWAVYRNVFDVLLTVGLLGATVIWVLGTAALLGIAINPVTQVIPVLLIGLAEDYAVHLTIGYRRKRAAGSSPPKAVLAAVLGIGGVLFVATVTNGLSFLSFGGADIALIRDFGTLMALGLAFSFLLTLTLIPAATVLADRRGARRGAKEAPPEGEEAKPPPSRTERALLRTVNTCTAHPASALAIVALLTAAAAIGATSLETTFSYDQITATDLEAVRTLNAAQDSYAASIQRVFIVVGGSVSDPAVFRAMASSAALAADDPYVSSAARGVGIAWVGSYASDLALRGKLEGASTPGFTRAFADAFAQADTDGNARLDANDSATASEIAALYDALLAAPGTPASELVHRAAGGGFDRAAIRVEAVRAVEHGDALAAALEADAAPLRALSSPPTVTVTGLPLLNREVMEAVQNSGWQSVLWTFLLALGILTVFFFAEFRSIALGPLTIAPTLIAVAWTLGAMVLAGLSLNMMTVMIATTTIGMGDLYAIHISHSYYRELRRATGPRGAARAMVSEAGAPLLEASATTALGFLILVFAPVPVIQSYGLIFAASIVFAFLYSIVVMPILVLLLARATKKVGVDRKAAEEA